MQSKEITMNSEYLKMVYFSYKGRVPRSTYWLYSIPLAVLCLPLYLEPEFINEYLILIIAFVAIYLGLMITIKRCYDRGRSGFFSLILLIPIISLWPAIELGFIKGTEGDNKYGPDPLNINDA
jgi:uncharacterized membrane protein YhaH (DUF805 family)